MVDPFQDVAVGDRRDGFDGLAALWRRPLLEECLDRGDARLSELGGVGWSDPFDAFDFRHVLLSFQA